MWHVATTKEAETQTKKRKRIGEMGSNGERMSKDKVHGERKLIRLRESYLRKELQLNSLNRERESSINSTV
ncbi:putative histone-lysine N-methyltransferase 2D-like [Sesbania bispinosa]|nr:putative histone-lysine N-methyltransferase 2D-like [Sesbania bispinosa]